MAEEGKAEVETVKLISSDGHVFIVDKKAATVSGTIKSILGNGNQHAKFAEEEDGKVAFDEIPSHILEKVIQYFYFKLKYTNRTSEEIPEFTIEPEIALELLMAANFLDA
uniref:Elongin-C n=1 Tax=Vannella robusta TaxID=1487602 RepID=A0A7S4HH21_9EUKA